MKPVLRRVSGFTLIQRLGADRNLGRVFGVLFTVGIAMGGLGALVAPALVSLLGLRPVLVLVGAILPGLAITLLPRFKRIDHNSEPPTELLSMLSSIALLAPLPSTTLEKVAAKCTMAEVASGCVIVAEGDHGDLFYGVLEGHLEVHRGGVQCATLGPGDHFGEIALIRNTNRLATVVAVSNVRLAVLGAPDLLDALTSCTAAYGIAWQGTETMIATHSAPPVT